MNHATPDVSGSRSRIAFIAMILVSLILFAVAIATARVWNYLNDDFYITYTFARNVADGKGFVYNGGEPILGTTTPLLTLLLAVTYRLVPGIPMPVSAIMIGALAWLIACWVLFYLLLYSKIPLFIASFACCCCVLWGGWVRSFFGSEQPIFFCILISCILTLSLKKYYLTGVLIGCLYLTRGEGVLLLPIALGWIILNKHKLSWSVILGFLTIVIPWSTYSLITFHSPFPSTLGAKIEQRASGLWGSIRDAWPNYLRAQIGSSMSLFAELPIFTSAWFGIVGLAYLYMHKEARILLLVAAFPLISLVGYCVLNVGAYHWYTYVFSLTIRALAAIGAAWLIYRLGRLILHSKLPLKFTSSILCLGVFTLSILPIARPIVNTFQSDTYFDARSTSYRSVANWINQNATDGQSLAYTEIGYLGYYTHLQIIDFAGLVTPTSVGLMGKKDLGTNIIETYHPTYVLYVPEFKWLTGEFVTSAIFRNEYEQVTVLQTDMPDKPRIEIWRIRSISKRTS